MRNAFGLAIAATLIVSGATGAVAATHHVNHSGHRYSTYRPGPFPIVPYGARNAFGSVAAPTIGGGCSARPFARDCDKRGPW